MVSGCFFRAIKQIFFHFCLDTKTKQKNQGFFRIALSISLKINTNYDSKLLINKLEYILHIQGKNYLHSHSYGNNF